MSLKRLALFMLLLFSIPVMAQIAEEIAEPDFIKTITFRSNTNEGELPILKLNERLILEFDALNANEEDFYYVIEHFNYDWTPSRLMKPEFLDGFDNQRIQNYENSFNTYQIYSHYTLQIPNRQTRLKVTGNYMISIYDDYGELMFSRKFMIYQDLAQVGVAVKRSRDVRYIASKQSVDISVSSLNLRFINPDQTVKTVILQNNNLNTAIFNLKPQYTLGNSLVYKYDTESSFWGGNEYLFFENKDVRSANVGVQFIDLKEIYHSYLFTDVIRADNPYTYNPDINGNFLITALDREDVRIEADYTVVHFSLQHPEITDGDIYIYGNYNNYALNDSNKMEWNSSSGLYEKQMVLKQGFYNYKYVIVDANNILHEGAISGDFDVTENNYKVIVYYRDLGARYDQIIGLGESTSLKISN
ncbi:MAG: DUF5103 domain-containing protein [Bacteroidia bacterium]|nr:DUF5103 domain-containing protein [Bacteroidia bacterium]NNF82950.1 DUF5103 domain-containing protein [Flavobacteriaceae bacterium]NNL80318.1 DUF5103 domain-containing protein [Flavobacteriaceae bacterium]